MRSGLYKNIVTSLNRCFRLCHELLCVSVWPREGLHTHTHIEQRGKRQGGWHMHFSKFTHKSAMRGDLPTVIFFHWVTAFFLPRLLFIHCPASLGLCYSLSLSCTSFTLDKTPAHIWLLFPVGKVTIRFHSHFKWLVVGVALVTALCPISNDGKCTTRCNVKQKTKIPPCDSVQATSFICVEFERLMLKIQEETAVMSLLAPTFQCIGDIERDIPKTPTHTHTTNRKINPPTRNGKQSNLQF